MRKRVRLLPAVRTRFCLNVVSQRVASVSGQRLTGGLPVSRRFFPSRFATSPHNSDKIAAIWKALAIAPVAVKSPQNETPPSLEFPRDRAGSNRSQGAKSPPPQASTPPRLLKTGAIATAFRIARPIVRKSLERFLSVISRPVQEALKPPRLP